VTRALSLLVLLPAVTLAAPAPAPKKFTLVFQGDNGGEIAPCG
jgi:hypothetical protein